MEAIFLSLGIFLFCAVVGCAMLSIIRYNYNLLQHLLIAPVIGLACAITVCFLFSRWGAQGIPAKTFGPWMTAGLFALSLVVLYIRRPIFPFKKYLPYLAFILLGFITASWGMLLYGFGWVSYGNDDWAVYCMAADDFLNHGYWDMPTSQQIVLEPTRSLWAPYALEGFPPGRVLIRSWIASVTGLSVHEVSMPILMAGQMMIISAAAALTLRNRRYRKPALLTAALASMMGLNSLAVLYQLTGQVLGTNLLLASAIVFLQPFSRFRKRALLKIILIASIISTGSCICYGETFAVLFTALVLYAGWSVVSRGFVKSCPLFAVYAASVLVAACVLQKYMFQMLWYVFMYQAPASGALGTTGHGGLGGSLLRFFILPDGPVKFWSVIPLQYHDILGLTGKLGTPYVIILLAICFGALYYSHSLIIRKYLNWRRLTAAHKAALLFATCVLIVAIRYCFFPVDGIFFDTVSAFLYSFPLMYVGVVLTVTAVVCTAWRVRHKEGNAIISLLMIGLFVPLVYRGMDFGTFKMSMIMQPFVLGTVSTAIYCWRESLRLKVFLCAPIVALGFITQCVYVQLSCTDLGGAFVEVINGSKMQIVKSYKAIAKTAQSDKHTSSVMFDTANIVLMKMSTSYFKGLISYFPARPRPGQIMNPIQTMQPKDLPKTVLPFNVHDTTKMDQMSSLNEGIESRVRTTKGAFDLRGEWQDRDKTKYSKNEFVLYENLTPAAMSERDLLIVSNPSQSILNRSARKSSGQDFKAWRWGDEKNHLIQIHSKLGQHYYVPENRMKVSMFQVEKDFFYQDSSFSWLGRHVLMQVVNPSANPRLVVNVTCSLTADGSNRLPPAVVIGKDRKKLNMMGRGSARVFSSPVVLQEVQGNYYIALDMGTEWQFPDHKTGLMLAYNERVKIDWRLLTCMGRDISLFSREEYEGLNPPSEVSRFPEDLANRSLEYSGVYEDGWVSENAFFRLSQPGDRPVLEIRGFIPRDEEPGPQGEQPRILKIIVDGKEVAAKEVRPGSLDVQVELSPAAGKRTVELHFSRFRSRLNALDLRPAACFLKYIGFKSR